MVNRNPKSKKVSLFWLIFFLIATKVSILGEIFDMFKHSYFFLFIFMLQHFG